MRLSNLVSLILTIVLAADVGVSGQKGKQVVNDDTAREIISSRVKAPVADVFLQQALNVYHELNRIFAIKHQSSPLLEDQVNSEFEFWISSFGNYDPDKCSVSFERSLLDRLSALIDYMLVGVAPVVTPELDRFIAVQRDKLFDECYRDVGTTLEERISQILPPEFEKLQKLVEYVDELRSLCDHGICFKKRLAMRLSEIIAPQYAPPARALLKRWLLRQGSPRSQFNDLSEVNFVLTCETIAEASKEDTLDNYVQYLEGFWLDKVEGLTKQWLRMRQLCRQYLSQDSNLRDLAFKALPAALMQLVDN